MAIESYLNDLQLYLSDCISRGEIKMVKKWLYNVHIKRFLT